MILVSSFVFFFNDTATTEIYTLSLHDALPISGESATRVSRSSRSAASSQALTSAREALREDVKACELDRKSTRLNSSHSSISYAVFCLKKKKKKKKNYTCNVILMTRLLIRPSL